ncbi:MAG: hypothetical protein AB1500_00850 [Bacillota bacterium]
MPEKVLKSRKRVAQRQERGASAARQRAAAPVTAYGAPLLYTAKSGDDKEKDSMPVAEHLRPLSVRSPVSEGLAIEAGTPAARDKAGAGGRLLVRIFREGAGGNPLGSATEEGGMITAPFERPPGEELTRATQQGAPLYWGQNVTPHAPAGYRVQRGFNASVEDFDGEKPAFGKRSVLHLDSTMSASWGASAGSQAIGDPKAVSWGAMQKDGEAGITGSPASGPPAATNLLTIQKHSGSAWTVGWTYFPKGFIAPDFEFKTVLKWYARPTLKTKAFEGNADAYYASVGKHKTQHKEGGKDVFWNFSAAMSARDRAAEQEHCNDHKYAYKISLKEAETVLKKYVVGKLFGPKNTEADVKQMILDRIQNKLTHPQLGNDKTKWAAKYDFLFRKTGDRDAKGWHTFKLGNRRTDKAGNVIYDIIKGTTKVNVVKSPAVIKY